MALQRCAGHAHAANMGCGIACRKREGFSLSLYHPYTKLPPEGKVRQGMLPVAGHLWRQGVLLLEQGLGSGMWRCPLFN